MKYSVNKIAFILVSLIIVVVAYLPALHINVITPCMFSSGGCKAVTATSTVHVYGGPITAIWTINNLDLTQGSSTQKSLDLWYATGQVCAVYKLYDSNKASIGSGTVCNPEKMDWGGAGSNWESTYTFSNIPAGQYYVGVTFYEDNNPKTTELQKGVTLT